MLTVATWNVNSIKARLPAVLAWLAEFKPDVLLLQEIKCLESDFPALEFAALGYAAAATGQKTYNGVAVLSKVGLAEVTTGLPGDAADTQARWLEAKVAENLRVVALYLPNGNPVADATGSPSDKFRYKLAWMERLQARAAELLEAGGPVLLGGDFNVLPRPEDCYDPKAWAGDALMRPETRSRFFALQHQGWTDAVRAFHPGAGLYSFWDYQAGAWVRNNGLRIDFLLASPAAADALCGAGIDKAPRGREKASDHTPVWCRLEL